MTAPPTERPALMGCPLCGGKAYARHDGDGHFVACIDCLCRTGRTHRDSLAITAWNTRHPSPALPTPALAGLRLAQSIAWAEREIITHRKTAERHDSECREESAALHNRDADHLNTLLNAICSGSALAPVPGAGWMPIETAPRDEQVLVVIPAYNDPSNEPLVGIGYQHHGLWYDEAGGVTYDPFYWRPLPAPPSPAEGGS